MPYKVNPVYHECACGCGSLIKIDKLYVQYHNRKGKKFSVLHRKRLSNSHKGLVPSNEARLKLSNSMKGKNKGRVHSKRSRRHMSEAHKGKQLSEATKRKLSLLFSGEGNPFYGKRHSIETLNYLKTINTGRRQSEKTKRKISKGNKGKKHKVKLASRKKMSASRYKLWMDSNYVLKQMQSRGVKPNKLELQLQSILNSLYPREWKFVGDGQVIIAGKCPDFINTNGQKKIIELFGDYWHRDDDPEDRADVFAPFGYKTLVIWERELKNIEQVKFRINRFTRG